MNESSVASVFVYGTLKRGQLREGMWPHQPQSVHAGQVRGQLYDFGAFPAMLEGEDWVLGEVWEFTPVMMPETLATLDIIEGYSNSADDLYKRVQVQCFLQNGRQTIAYGYQYADTGLPDSIRIFPIAGEPCCWPRED